MENGAITAADYRRLTEQYVRLPSGALFLLRRPTLAYRLKHFGSYSSIAARSADPGVGSAAVSDQEAKQLVEMYYDVLCECCVKPRVSTDYTDFHRLDKDSEVLNQSEESVKSVDDVLHPEQIQLRDALFIARWAGGEVSADGADLAKFRSDRTGPAPSGAPGPSSGDVALQAQQAAGPAVSQSISPSVYQSTERPSDRGTERLPVGWLTTERPKD